MEGHKSQTCDFYRTDPKLPERFNNPDCFHGYRVTKTHSLYRTWNQTYGSRKPTVHEMQTQFKVTPHQFSRQQLKSGMYHDHGFNTAMERSRIMLSMETQNKKSHFQHLHRFGNQSREHPHQNSIKQ
ncbi:piercer of microtubule wall 2 protein isoform 2-T2 [Anableps anableps]